MIGRNDYIHGYEGERQKHAENHDTEAWLSFSSSLTDS